MPITSFKEMMAEARRGRYAVGYFESWNLESLLAVADAAEETRSPVILGFSGIYLPDPRRQVTDRLSHYAALGLEVCRGLSVPACLLFNESANMDWVLDAVGLGFQLVMFTDDTLEFDEQAARVREVVAKAHARSVAVEAEIIPLPGAGGGVVSVGAEGCPSRGTQPCAPASHLTDCRQAREFVEATGVDALAVDIGQAHLHGRATVRLNLERLEELNDAVSVPMVLHGASSVAREDLVEATRRGIRKINVGSNLKRAYFDALRRACMEVGDDYNPYQVIGSGLPEDVLTAGRIALQKTVEDLMRLFGSAGNAQ